MNYTQTVDDLICVGQKLLKTKHEAKLYGREPESCVDAGKYDAWNARAALFFNTLFGEKLAKSHYYFILANRVESVHRRLETLETVKMQIENGEISNIRVDKNSAQINKVKGMRSMSNQSKKIFISYATADKGLVDSFTRFLKNGLDISSKEIFCTLSSGAMRTGYDFIPQIKENLEDCCKVVFLITENYFKSPFCMAELGAAWAINQNIYPIIVPPVKFSDLDKTPLKGVQARDISANDSLTVLNDEFINDGIVATTNTSQLMSAMNEFRSVLNSTMNKSVKFLETDTEGFAVATVVEYNQLRNTNGHILHGYKIKEQLDTGQLTADDKSHWLACRPPSAPITLSPNEKIKFKPKDVHEDIEGYKEDRLFIISDWLAVDVRL